MTDVPPPWARPRPGEEPPPPPVRPVPAPPEPEPAPAEEPPLFAPRDEQLFPGPAVRQRAREELPEVPRTARRLGSDPPARPPGAGKPPPGRRPPPAAPAPPPEGPAAPATPQDTVGLIAGPVRMTKPTLSEKSSPGLVAVAIAAGLTLVATGGRALTGGVGLGLLLAGIVLPLVLVAAVAVIRHRAARSPASSGGSVRHFTVRTTAGLSVPGIVRDGQPADALRTHDLVRLVKGRRGRIRAVEVLAGLNGPVVRRLVDRPALGAAEWAGFASAAVLLAVAAVILLGLI